jgi:hypothetical protein
MWHERVLEDYVRRSETITNPLVDVRFYALYIGVITVLGIAFVHAPAWTRSGDALRVRDAIFRHLQLPPEQASLAPAQEQVLALICCRARRLQGRLISLKSQRRLWLCFLDRQLLVISPRTGVALQVPPAEMQRIYLVKGRSASRFPLGIETGGGVSFVELSRLDDMVRIVNVLKRQGAVLRYLEQAN